MLSDENILKAEEVSIVHTYAHLVRKAKRLQAVPNHAQLVPGLASGVAGELLHHVGAIGHSVGVGDASLRMHRLHDVLQFLETSLKNRIVKN